MSGILIKGSYPITITQCTVNGRAGSSDVIKDRLSGFTKRFISNIKYGI